MKNRRFTESISCKFLHNPCLPSEAEDSSPAFGTSLNPAEAEFLFLRSLSGPSVFAVKILPQRREDARFFLRFWFPHFWKFLR